MGFYCKYSLTVDGNPPYGHTHRIEDKYGMKFGVFCKWNNDNIDMLTWSKKYPQFVFVLTVETENHNWFRRYFKNGAWYEVDGDIAYPEFDEAELEDSE